MILVVKYLVFAADRRVVTREPRIRQKLPTHPRRSMHHFVVIKRVVPVGSPLSARRLELILRAPEFVQCLVFVIRAVPPELVVRCLVFVAGKRVMPDASSSSLSNESCMSETSSTLEVSHMPCLSEILSPPKFSSSSSLSNESYISGLVFPLEVSNRSFLTNPFSSGDFELIWNMSCLSVIPLRSSCWTDPRRSMLSLRPYKRSKTCPSYRSCWNFELILVFVATNSVPHHAQAVKIALQPLLVRIVQNQRSTRYRRRRPWSRRITSETHHRFLQGSNRFNEECRWAYVFCPSSVAAHSICAAYVQWLCRQLLARWRLLPVQILRFALTSPPPSHTSDVAVAEAWDSALRPYELSILYTFQECHQQNCFCASGVSSAKGRDK